MYQGKQNRSSKASLLPEYNQGSLEQYMQILYTHQKQSQKSGKYLEADMAKKKLNEMKTQLQKHRNNQMISKQQDQKRQVQNAHLEEISQFNKFWDEKFIEYQQEAQKIEYQVLQRHEKQLVQYHQQLQNSLGYKSKQTSQLINLRKIEENLAKNQDYIEAHKVQKQIQEIQQNQFEKWNVGRTNKIKNLLTQLKTKQDNELNALRQRIEQGFEQQKKIRSDEQQKLIQKYINFIKQLCNHHRQQKVKLNKSFKNQTPLNFSRQSMNNSNMSRISQK